MLTKVENLIGQTIAGYRLLEVLGKGGMSCVFLAQRLDNSQELVALKVLAPSSIMTPEELASFQARFLREAQAAYHLHHQHILPVLGYGAADDIFYMIMPVISGGTLAELLASKQSPLPLSEIASYLNQLASAIDYAHQQGLIHRDIKPSNVLLDEQGNVYLVDFGILHLFDSGLYAIDEAPTTLTASGKMYGTPAYMAPERFTGEQSEPATDIYALGVLLYQLVTGQVPFKADSPLTVGLKHLNEIPTSPRSLRPDLPEPAEAAILRALAKQPADRFARASALAAAFDAGIKGQWVPGLLPLASPPPMPPNPLDEQREQPVLVPIVPVGEGSLPADKLVLGPALASAPGEALVADAPTQANLPPIVPPSSSQGQRRPLLAAAALAGILLLAGLLLLGVQKWHSPPTPNQQILPSSTSGAPIKKGVTPAPSTGLTPTLTTQTTPTSGVKPTPTPKTTPSPVSTPSSTPGITPSPSLTPSPTPSPTPTSTPTPTPTPDPTP